MSAYLAFRKPRWTFLPPLCGKIGFSDAYRVIINNHHFLYSSLVLKQLEFQEKCILTVSMFFWLWWYTVLQDVMFEGTWWRTQGISLYYFLQHVNLQLPRNKLFNLKKSINQSINYKYTTKQEQWFYFFLFPCSLFMCI